MRKIFIGLAMLSGMLVSAQYFGAKAGINFANIKPDVRQKWDFRLGFSTIYQFFGQN